MPPKKCCCGPAPPDASTIPTTQGLGGTRKRGQTLRGQLAVAFDMPPAQRRRVQALVLALVTAAMGSPKIAAAAQAGNEHELKKSLDEGVELGVALVVQLALDGFFLGESLGSLKVTPARAAAFRKTLLWLIDRRPS